MALMTGMQELEGVRAQRARCWRVVRDRGAVGMPLAELATKVPELDALIVERCVAQLLRDGFVRELPKAEPPRLVVCEDCRVPLGEEARLGPGWNEAAELASAGQVVDSWKCVAPTTYAVWQFVKDAPGVKPRDVARALNLSADQTATTLSNLRNAGYVQQVSGRGSGYVVCPSGRAPRFEGVVTTGFQPQLLRCVRSGLVELRVTPAFCWVMTPNLARQLVQAIDEMGGVAGLRERLAALAPADDSNCAKDASQ